MDTLDYLAKLKLKQYNDDFFKEYWQDDDWFGDSRRKMIHKKSFIAVYELWKDNLICRVFYLEEGYRNLKIYHETTEVTRFLAGSNQKLIRGIYSGMNGLGAYTIDNNYLSTWKKASVGSYDLTFAGNWAYSYELYEHNNFLELMKQSNQKYSAADLVIRQENSIDDLFNYFYEYKKTPILEVILKLGLSHLIDETHRFRNRFNTLPEILGVKKQDFKYLKEGMSLYFVRKHAEYLNTLSLEVANYVWREQSRADNPNIDLFYRKTAEYLYNSNGGYSIYSDYLRFAEEIGLDLRRNKYLYPKDLNKAHDDAYSKIKQMETQHLAEDFLEQYESHKKHIYEQGDFIIKPVKTPDELAKESRELNHCVRSYSKQVAKGKTEILFVRNVKEQETPLITVEVKNKSIIQVKGKNNRIPPNEVRLFLLDWSKKKGIHYDYAVY